MQFTLIITFFLSTCPTQKMHIYIYKRTYVVGIQWKGFRDKKKADICDDMLPIYQ